MMLNTDMLNHNGRHVDTSFPVLDVTDEFDQAPVRMWSIMEKE